MALSTERMTINLNCLLSNVAECCSPKSTGQTEMDGECAALPTLRKHSDGNKRRRERGHIFHQWLRHQCCLFSLGPWSEKNVRCWTYPWQPRTLLGCHLGPITALFQVSVLEFLKWMERERARASQWASKRISSFYICFFWLWGFIRINKVVTTPGTLEKDTFMCTGNDAIFFTYFCQMSFPLITWFWEVWRNLVFIILFSDSTILLKRN